MTDDILTHFLGAYFHQDWYLEADDDAGIVELYLRNEADHKPIDQLVETLEIVAANHESDSSTRWLSTDYCCDYDPSPDGLSGSEWLRRLASLLRQSQQRRGISG